MKSASEDVSAKPTWDSTESNNTPIFLKEYFHRGRLQVDYKELSKPQHWHGAPVASLRRAFLLLGNVRVRVLDKDTFKKLQRLRDLYFFDEEEDTETSGQQPDTSALNLDHEEEHPNDEEDLIEEKDINPRYKTRAARESSRQKKRKLNEGKRDRQPLADKTRTYCPILDREVTAYWDLGPEISTEDAVRLVAPRL